MTKVLIHQEDILILNVYVPSNRDIKKNVKKILIELKGKIGKDNFNWKF